MFQAVPLSIIRSFSLYTQQWQMSYRFADSLRTGSGRNSSILIIRLYHDAHSPELQNTYVEFLCCRWQELNA